MKRKKQRARRVEKRFGVESLEERRLLTTVTSALDAGPGTLREAAASNDGTITFALPAGTDTITLSSGQIVIGNSVSIDGNDPVNGNITVDANGTSRVFYIDDGNAGYANVSISNLTITGGYSNDGGGIQGFEHLTLDNVIVTGNSVGGGGDAGGIGHGNETRTAGNLLIMNSQINNNRADDDAAAIDHYNAGNFTLMDSEVSGNADGNAAAPPQAGGLVGAIRVIDLSGAPYGGPATTVTVDNVLFDGNKFVGDGANGYGVGLGVLLITDQNGLMTADINNITITNTVNESVPDPAGANATMIQGSGLSLTDIPTATVSNSTFSNNEAGYGGGLFFSNGAVTQATGMNVVLNNVVISGNTATSQGFPAAPSTYFPPGGPGMFINGGSPLSPLTVTVNDSVISGNSSEGVGGGVYVYAAQLTLNNSTVSGNVAGTRGGGIFVNGGLYGYPGTSPGGIFLNYSTVTENSAGTEGGGVFLSPKYGTYGNNVYQESYLDMRNSIVSGNSATNSGSDVYDLDFIGYGNNRVRSSYFSIIGDNSGTMLTAANPGPDANGNIIGEPGNLVDAMLNPLTDNGGDTLTHSLMSGSPAVDAGDPTAVAGVGGVPEFDQRGDPFGRVEDDDNNGTPRIDIGAHEGVGGRPTGDFDGNGVWDCLDLTLLSQAIAAGSTELRFDMNGDGVIDAGDVRDGAGTAADPGFGNGWLAIGGKFAGFMTTGFLEGDADLDGVVDGIDFIQWNSTKFTPQTDGPCVGDFNLDSVVDGLDFIIWNANKFTSAQSQPASLTVNVNGLDFIDWNTNKFKDSKVDPGAPNITLGGTLPEADVRESQAPSRVVQQADRVARNIELASHKVEQASTEVRRTTDRVKISSLDRLFAELGA